MSKKRENNQFLVRIWWEQRDGTGKGGAIWRGLVRHIPSGEASYVQDLDGLVGFIEQWTGSLTPHPDDDQAGGA